MDAAHEQQRTAASASRISGEVRLAQGSAADLANLNRALNTLGTRSSVQRLNISQAEGLETKRPAKRKRRTSTNGDPPDLIDSGGPGIVERITSRDAMPPPRRPERDIIATQTPQSRGDLDRADDDRRNPTYQTPAAPRPLNGQVENATPLEEAKHRHQGPSTSHAHPQNYPSVQRLSTSDGMYGDTAMFSKDSSPDGEQDLAQRIQSFKYGPAPSSDTAAVAIRGRNGAFVYTPQHNPLEAAQEASVLRLSQPREDITRQPGLASLNSGPASNLSLSQLHSRTPVPLSHDLTRIGTTEEDDQLNHPFPGNGHSIPSGAAQTSNALSHPYGQPVPCSTNDGELDNILHPMPQRPIYRSASVSPNRARLTLPPTPRNTSVSNVHTHSGAGLFSHVRSSSTNANMLTPQSTASHRQQLGLSSSNGPPYSQSPFFPSRHISPQHQLQPVRRPHSIAPPAPGPLRTPQNNNPQFRQPQPSQRTAQVAPSPFFTPQNLNAQYQQLLLNRNHNLQHEQPISSRDPRLQPLAHPNNHRNQTSTAGTPRPPGEDLGSRYMTATGVTGQARQPSARMDPQVLNSLSFLNEPTVSNEHVGGRRKARR